MCFHVCFMFVYVTMYALVCMCYSKKLKTFNMVGMHVYANGKRKGLSILRSLLSVGVNF